MVTSCGLIVFSSSVTSVLCLMGTPSEAVIRHKYRLKTPSAPSTAPSSAVSSSYLKQEYLLHDWWLVKVISDFHGKRLGIEGFSSRDRGVVRCFSSAPIVKRIDAVTLATADGKTVMVHGHLNRHRSLQNGFSHEICQHFMIGFPYYWEEFAGAGVSAVDETAILEGQSEMDVSEHKKESRHKKRDTRNKSEVEEDIKSSSVDLEMEVSEHKNENPNKKVGGRKGRPKKRGRRSNSEVEEGMAIKSSSVEHTGRLTRSKTRLLREK
ncbi:kinetochore-associated protein KNL-2 homolog [Andrographis paniculata]|uniref:kinetochore-associated protein KNL-2 homolog n=1 Tax=Andrographis paniculata TaxID=175694 RepID=UPI0021E90511|nr:kinetochore-associated protein KNL-2 homolog [Andrographis paniculata]